MSAPCIFDFERNIALEEQYSLGFVPHIRLIDFGNAVDAIDGFFLESLIEVGNLLKDKEGDPDRHDSDEEKCEQEFEGEGLE